MGKRVISEDELIKRSERSRKLWQNDEYRKKMSVSMRAAWQKPEIRKARHVSEKPEAPLCGIYKIENTISGKCYIGSSVNLRDRWREHRLKLRTHRHRSKHMQAAWDFYGEDAFIFVILEIVADAHDLLTREQHWIDTLKVCDREYGYNSTPVAGSRLGSINSEETRRKIGLGGMGLHIGEKASNVKLKELEVVVIKKRIAAGENDSSIAQDYNVSRDAIARIRKEQNWKHVPWPKGLSENAILELKHKVVSHAKLTEEQVAVIKKRLLDGDLQYEIARDYGVHPVTIMKINNDQRWTQVPWPGEHKKTRRFTNQDIGDIKKRLASGESRRTIIADYGVWRSTISNIATGKRFAKVPPSE